MALGSRPVTTARPRDGHLPRRPAARRMRAAARVSGRPGDDAPDSAIGPRLTPGWAQAGTPARAAASIRSPKPRMSVMRRPLTMRTCQRRAVPPASRTAGDVQPHQKCPGAGGHLSDHRSCTGGSRAGPPGGDLVALAAVGVAGTPRRTPADAGVEQIPDGIKVAGLQGGPDSSGERGRLFRGAGIVWHEDLPCSAQLPRSSVDAPDTRAGEAFSGGPGR
jgi:hypothetical protein